MGMNIFCRPVISNTVMRNKQSGFILLVAVFGLIGVACSSAAVSQSQAIEMTPASQSLPAVSTASPFASVSERSDSGSLESTASTGEPFLPLLQQLNPDGPKLVDMRQFRQLLDLDAIRPIYDPTINTPDELDLDSGELVIGVSINGESRAYPIRTLRFREIANDELGGTPILVTW